MLSYNVAELLRSAPGTSRRYDVDGATMPIADDLELARPIAGEVHPSRTSRSILARASLNTAVAGRCSRCLGPVVERIDVEIEEEALPSIDIDSGLPVDRAAEPEVLRLDEHHELDLSQPVREAISLAEPIAPLCQPGCRGLCVVCGANLNAEPAHRHADEEIDPRFAGLLAWQPADERD